MSVRKRPPWRRPVPTLEGLRFLEKESGRLDNPGVVLQVASQGLLNAPADKRLPLPEGTGPSFHIRRVILAAEGAHFQVYVSGFRPHQGITESGVGQQFRKYDTAGHERDRQQGPGEQYRLQSPAADSPAYGHNVSKSQQGRQGFQASVLSTSAGLSRRARAAE